MQDLTEDELRHVLRAVLSSESPLIISERRLDVVREEAGRHELDLEAAVQQQLFVQILLVSVLNQLAAQLAQQQQQVDAERATGLAREVHGIVTELLEEVDASWGPRQRLLFALEGAARRPSLPVAVTEHLVAAILHASASLTSSEAANLLQDVLPLLGDGRPGG